MRLWPQSQGDAKQAAREAATLAAQADAARDAGNALEAAQLYESAIATGHVNAALFVQCGHMHKEAGNLQAAEKHYLQAKALIPDDPDLNLQFGHFYKIAGRPGDAVKSYARAAALSPGWEAPLAEIAELRSRLSGPLALVPTRNLINMAMDGTFASNAEDLAGLMPERLVGYIEHASLTTVSGWIAHGIKSKTFFVEMDGVDQQIIPKFYSRPDLISASADALAFEANFEAKATNFELAVGYFSGPNETEKKYIPFLSSGQDTTEISEPSPTRIVITAEELSEIAASIEADSKSYLTFVQKFGYALASSDIKFDVIFIDGVHFNTSSRYRILNVTDGLRALGYSSIYVRTDKTELHTISKLSARVVVFFRAPLDDDYQILVDAFRAKGSRIVYDVDDLVFDENIIAGIDGVRYLNPEETEAYLWGVSKYRRFALEADLLTVSTEYLADYARKSLGCNAIRVRNTIGKAYLAGYPDDRVSYDREGPGFVIGYYSGSKTHQVDFQQAYSAIVRFMRTYSDSVFRIVGMFDIHEFPDLEPLRDRIIPVPMLRFHEMIEDLANCDVIIAPLVPGDAFCESKSELKFFEAALRGRPCIASATTTYAAATENGRYAFLANTSDEWFEALSKLYFSPQLRRELAMSARAHVVRTFSYSVAGAEAANAYFGLPLANINEAPPVAARDITRASGAPLSIGVIIPGLVIGGGGHRKILKFCHDWAHAGTRITLYVDSGDHPDRIRQQIRTHFFDFVCDIKNYRGSIGTHDAIICTHWTTAYSLRKHKKPSDIVYFVQDFEPMFDPVGTTYVKALATYRLGFHTACYGNWVAERLRREFDLQPTIIPFSMDRGVYRPKRDAAKVVDVLFFARPSQPRRCFELGAEVLRQVHKANRAIRIGLYGEDSYGDLGFPYHNYGMVKDVKKLADIYAKAKLGICFSTTNPSLVGYEMIACGLPLLDIRVPGYEVNFGGEDFVYYADPTPESILESISNALDNDAERVRRSAAGLKYITAMPDDRVIGVNLMTLIEKIQAQR